MSQLCHEVPDDTQPSTVTGQARFDAVCAELAQAYATYDVLWAELTSDAPL